MAEEAKKIAFLGLGNLGRSIVKRLREVFKDKLTLYLWSRDEARVEAFASEVGGIPIHRSFPDVDIVFICLFDSSAVESVMPMIPKEGKIIVDMTTNLPEKAAEFQNLVGERGGRYIECPVVGSIIPASQGKLTLLVCGAKDTYEKVKELLDALATKIFYFGDKIPFASKVKLINNLVLGVFMAGIAEAIAVGEKLGIPPEISLDVLSSGAGRSQILESKKEKILNLDFSPHFSIALISKDLKYLRETLGISDQSFLFSLAEKLYNSAQKNGLSQLDFSSIYLLYKKLSNQK